MNSTLQTTESALNCQVAIVSIFGRGHWLSVELARLGVSVTLFDVTHLMGRWAPEDGEGPFGFFKASSLKESQMERLLEDDPPVLVGSGFTIWLPDGPVELKGPTADLRLKHWGMSPEAIDYISGRSSSVVKASALARKSFDETWLAHLAHSFSSVISTLLPESLSVSLKRDLFSSFMIRQATRGGLEKSLKWCESFGVKVYRNAEIKDIAFHDRKDLEGFAVKTDRPGLFRAEKFVWCLSSEETGMLGSQVQENLYPLGAVEPEWIWIRYRLRMENQAKGATNSALGLPLHSVIISDLHLNWVCENMIILQRTVVADTFDAWIRIANTHRFQSQYLEEKGREICHRLEAKIPEQKISLSELPAETQMTFLQLGPARHPLFSRGKRETKPAKKLSNVHYDSPQTWEALGWEGQFASQEEILKDLSQWWQKREELRKKREAKLQKQQTGAEL